MAELILSDNNKINLYSIYRLHYLKYIAHFQFLDNLLAKSPIKLNLVKIK